MGYAKGVKKSAERNRAGVNRLWRSYQDQPRLSAASLSAWSEATSGQVDYKLVFAGRQDAQRVAPTVALGNARASVSVKIMGSLSPNATL